MEVLIQNMSNITWQMLVMWAIGGVLIYLAIAKEMEPTLLLPMGFGAILVNLPLEIAGGYPVFYRYRRRGIVSADAVYRYRSNDRLYSVADESKVDDLWRCRAVRYLLHAGTGLPAGL